jgi:hypothetical protein
VELKVRKMLDINPIKTKGEKDVFKWMLIVCGCCFGIGLGIGVLWFS